MNEENSGLIRPMSEDRFFLLALLGGMCYAAGGVAAGVAAASGWEELAHPMLLLVAGVGIFGIAGIAMVGIGVLRSAAAFERMRPIVSVALFAPPPVITLAQIGIGPITPVAAVFYCVVPIFAYFMMSPLQAWLLVAVVGLLYGSVLIVQGGYPIPLATWFAVVAAVASTCYVFGRLIRSAVDESERSARLRHFLAPSVADALLSGDHGGVLTPHRREIAVFFADLRGFTDFAARAEPEDVLSVLNEYYETVGAVLHRHGATIGDYIGDGIMAYLNDPLPVPEPAATAVQMATEARDGYCECFVE